MIISFSYVHYGSNFTFYFFSYSFCKQKGGSDVVGKQDIRKQLFYDCFEKIALIKYSCCCIASIK